MPIELAVHSNRTSVIQNIKRRKEKKHKQNTCITVLYVNVNKTDAKQAHGVSVNDVI